MGEVWSAFAESIRNRATSTTLVTYTMFWAIWHWQGIYVTLFVNEDLILGKFGLLKNEYVLQHFFGWHEPWMNAVAGYTVPAICTLLFIGPFQSFLLSMYKVEQDNRTARRKVRLEQNSMIKELEAKLASERAKKTSAEAKELSAAAQKVKAHTKLVESTREAERVAPEARWEREYRVFRNTKYYKEFSSLIEAVYEHKGQTKIVEAPFDNILFSVSAELLAYADSEGLVVFNSGHVAFTNKGKYFVARYQRK